MILTTLMNEQKLRIIQNPTEMKLENKYIFFSSNEEDFVTDILTLYQWLKLETGSQVPVATNIFFLSYHVLLRCNYQIMLFIHINMQKYYNIILYIRGYHIKY